MAAAWPRPVTARLGGAMKNGNAPGRGRLGVPVPRLARAASAAALCALALAGCSSFVAPEVFLEERQIEPPSLERITVCAGEVCAKRREVSLTAEDRDTLRAFFAGTEGVPAAEREAVKRAIVWFERRAGVDDKRPPTEELDKQNVKEVFWNYHSCVDDTANTTTFLLTLEQLGVLTQHEVEGQAYRGLVIDGRVPHFTAVIREKDTGEEYAVDTWLYTTGEPVIVKPLSDWLWAY